MSPARQPRRRAPPNVPVGSESWGTPWVLLRSAAYHPFLYRSMIRSASPDARPGHLVAVYDKHGERFGTGFYNPRSRISLRMVSFDAEPVAPSFFTDLLVRAVSLRRDLLALDGTSNAYRLVHAEGDGISGLVVDRFADILSVETFALGPHQRIAEFLPVLHEAAGTDRAVVRMDARAAEREGCPAMPEILPEGLRAVRIEEHGVRFAVSFIEGQKTGFFCDQRENRKRFAELSKDRAVLDVCCYTGGFSVVAVKRGGAREATGVDLDEKAIDQARHNANLNQVRVNWTHADAFTYLRQMVRNGRNWDAIVVDPPKFIPTREDVEEGQKKYYDLNRLALQVASPGGLFVTCSCSGLLPPEEFEKLVFRAARAVDRRLQVLDVTGAGPDHPVASNCPESRYLKVLWTRVL